MNNNRPSLSYRADVDGLRALAVLPVLFFHADLGFPGGFVGVDMFFVISGFLIASLVVSEIQTDTFRLADFWERRIRRIFPALAVVMAATLVAGAIWMVPQHFAELGQSVVAQPLLVANFYFWKQSGYFETASEFQPLLHTWSLALEEQFYLLFPLAMILFLRRGMATARAAVLVFMTGSLAWSIYGSVRYPDLSFFLLPSRIWELNIGVLLALLPKRKVARPSLDNLLGWSGIAAIGYSIFFYDVNTVFPGCAAAMPCLGTALLIFSNSAAPNSTGLLLAKKPLVFVGKISYSLYLWHWPVIVFLKYTFITGVTPLHLTGALVLTFFIAILSWKYVETPFRRKSFCGTPKELFAVAAFLATLFIATGTILYKNDGIPGRLPEHVSRHRRTPSAFNATPGLLQLAETGTLPVIGAGEESNAGNLLAWGDSHMMSMLPAFDRLGRENGVKVHLAVKPGFCPIAETYSAKNPNLGEDPGSRVLKYLETSRIEHVFMTARWDLYVFGRPGGEYDFLLSDAATRSRTPEEAARIFVKYLRKTILRLNEMGVRVWVMRDVGLQPRSVPETVAQAASRGLDLNSFAISASEVRTKAEPINALLEEALAGLDVTVLDPIPYLTDDAGRYLMAKDGVAIFNDRDHFSPTGSNVLAPLLIPVFKSAGHRVGKDSRE